jgi:hypothetical protein
VQLLGPGAIGGGDLVAGGVARHAQLVVEVAGWLPDHHPTIVLPTPAKLLAVTSWNDFEQEASELAEAVQARLLASRHSILGTVRIDGAPRLSGLEAHFGEGELWLAMMPDSRKADDLRRDPRFSLHSAPDVELIEGDAKISGRARPVTDDATTARFVARLPMDLPPSGMALFRAELIDASLARVDGDFMVIDVWRPGQVPRQVRRQ